MCINGHARMLEPASRSSMWRFGYRTPVNYDDNQLFCGGYRNTALHNGKCGVCGDPYQGPYENEAGGRFATGTIVRVYKSGALINVTVDVSAYHRGHFEFRLCPNNDVTTAVLQECLDKHPMKIQEAEGDRLKFYPPGNGIYHLKLEIPHGLQCSQCVMQWKYTTGNFWGTEKNGKSCIGCGPQEMFVNCADIAIGNKTLYLQNKYTRNSNNKKGNHHSGWAPKNNKKNKHDHSNHHHGDKEHDFNSESLSGHSRQKVSIKYDSNLPKECGRCYALPTWRHFPHMDDWCETNCKKGNCPPCRCYCGCPHLTIKNPCVGRDEYDSYETMADWCWRECCESECPVDKCACDASVKYPATYTQRLNQKLFNVSNIKDVKGSNLLKKLFDLENSTWKRGKPPSQTDETDDSKQEDVQHTMDEQPAPPPQDLLRSSLWTGHDPGQVIKEEVTDLPVIAPYNEKVMPLQSNSESENKTKIKSETNKKDSTKSKSKKKITDKVPVKNKPHKKIKDTVSLNNQPPAIVVSKPMSLPASDRKIDGVTTTEIPITSLPSINFIQRMLQSASARRNMLKLHKEKNKIKELKSKSLGNSSIGIPDTREFNVRGITKEQTPPSVKQEFALNNKTVETSAKAESVNLETITKTTASDNKDGRIPHNLPNQTKEHTSGFKTDSTELSNNILEDKTKTKQRESHKRVNDMVTIQRPEMDIPEPPMLEFLHSLEEVSKVQLDPSDKSTTETTAKTTTENQHVTDTLLTVSNDTNESTNRSKTKEENVTNEAFVEPPVSVKTSTIQGDNIAYNFPIDYDYSYSNTDHVIPSGQDVHIPIEGELAHKIDISNELLKNIESIQTNLEHVKSDLIKNSHGEQKVTSHQVKDVIDENILVETTKQQDYLTIKGENGNSKFYKYTKIVPSTTKDSGKSDTPYVVDERFLNNILSSIKSWFSKPMYVTHS